MSTPHATEQVKRRGRPPAVRVSIEDDWRAYSLERLASATAIRFPSARYQRDPVAFASEILGVGLWDKQIELLEAIRDHDRVACKSGRRVSKSHSAATAALWWYCSYPDARVVMSSTTARQVDTILWRELSMLRARAGRCTTCKAAIAEMIASGIPSVVAEQRISRPCPHSALIDGEIGMLARTGLKSDDFREIWGFTASQAEAVQGIAGSRMLFIIDEASGVPQPIYDAIEGNRAGGAKVLLIGNPTKNSGEFFDAFHSKSKHAKSREIDGVGYHNITISSEDSPNVRAGRVVFPGLATTEYIREREIEWGRDSAMFRVHVLGMHALNEEGRIFSVHAIGDAEARWHDTPDTGRLFIGLDPAGESGSGDETCFAVRRGMKCLKLAAFRGLNEDKHIVQLLALIQQFALPREVPVVVVDRSGSIGSALAAKLRVHVETQGAAPFELVAIKYSDRAVRNPQVYDRMRDGLAANLEQWFRDGGTIPEDVKLAAELHELTWKQAVNGRLKVTPKEALYKTLGRSPDRYDALSLACWEPLSLVDDELPAAARAAAEPTHRPDVDDNDDAPALDPYSGAGAWRR